MAHEHGFYQHERGRWTGSPPQGNRPHQEPGSKLGCHQGRVRRCEELRVLKEVENEQGTSTFDRGKALTELAALSFDRHVQTR